jgi:hypothetical protein
LNPSELLLNMTGPVLGGHTGPGALGVGKPLKSILHMNPNVPIYLGTGNEATVKLTGEIAEDDMPEMNMQVVSDFNIGDLSMAGDTDFDFERPADPVERLKKMIEERQAETVEILRSWMDESGEKAR